jgi:hypothetical protein
MAYDPNNIIKDVNTKKEFLMYKPNINNFLKENKSLADDTKNDVKEIQSMLYDSGYLQIHSYQKLLMMFQNPNNVQNSVFVKWEPGTGKTIASLATALQFSKYMKANDNMDLTNPGSIFILGFNKSVFRKELLMHPEFGFITNAELQYYSKLKSIIKSTSYHDNRLNDFIMKINKRFTNRKRNGYFKFYGYREFLNVLFKSHKKINNMTEEEIREGVKNKTLKINRELLDQFTNSVLICDEVHHVYNSQTKNNWGIALQVVKDNTPTLRTILLSATPIKNSPTEIIDLLNLLTNESLKKTDFFDNNKLKMGALEKLKNIMRGKFSYLRDVDKKHFPEKKILGDEIKNIDYLKFIRCEMSPFHMETYKKSYTGAVAQDALYITDFALPSPDTDAGLFTSYDIKNKISFASIEWKEKFKIDWDDKLIGDFLIHENIKEYSTKYYEMLDQLLSSIRLGLGKIFLYHNMVQISGVLFIQELLKANGIIDETSNANDETLCSICGQKKVLHEKKGNINLHISSRLIDEFDEWESYLNIKTKIKNKKDILINVVKERYETNHQYIPVRFIIAHSLIPKTNIKDSLNKYNEKSNAFGWQYMILIGSPILNESFDIKNTNHMFILNRPDDIPTLIQIIGRIFRKYSHMNLPRERWKVWVKIFVSSLPGLKSLSYEENRYLEKVELYKTIQLIEKSIHEVAFDAAINRDIIAVTDNKGLDALPYEPDHKIKLNNDVDLSTFNAYYAKDEVDMIVVIMKKLFIYRRVWKKEDLFERVRSDQYHEVNTSLFSEDNLIIALYKLLWLQEYIEVDIYNKDQDDLVQLTDPNNKIISWQGQKNVVVEIGDFYMLVPYDKKPIIDIESPYSTIRMDQNQYINIDVLIKNKHISDDYNQRRLKFKKQYEHVDLDEMENAVCDMGKEFHMKFLEETISYIFNMWSYSFVDEFHEFYIKMLYYYDLIGIVIFANMIRDEILEKYKKYVIQTTKVKKNELIKLLETTMNKTESWCSDESKQKFTSHITRTLNETKKLKRSNVKPVPAEKLPIGHFMDKYPKFYDPETKSWHEDPNFELETRNWVENPIIIGYDEKSEAGIHIRFKIRNPIQNIKIYKDSRKIERGSTCTSKSKNYLLGVAQQLGIKLDNKNNVGNLCEKIRTMLIRKEIEARQNKTGLRWFYHYFDHTRPELND